MSEIFFYAHVSTYIGMFEIFLTRSPASTTRPNQMDTSHSSTASPPAAFDQVNHSFLLEEGFAGGANGKESACRCWDTRDMGSIPGSGRSHGVGNGTPFQYSCLGNPMDRGPWWATVHGVAKSQTLLSTSFRNFLLPTRIHTSGFLACLAIISHSILPY